MPRYTAVIPSSWSAERAFGYMSDFANAAQWDPGVLESCHLDAGVLGVGSEFELVVSFAGRARTMRYRIEQFEQNRHVVFSSVSPALRSVDTLSFEAQGERCVMTYVADLTFAGAAAVANPILALFFRRVGNRARDSLRSLLGH